MKNTKEDAIAINDSLRIILDGSLITTFIVVIVEIIRGFKYLSKERKKLLNTKIEDYEESINLADIEEKINEDYINNLQFGSIILKYCHILIDTLDKENLKLFYHNINTLKILTHKFSLLDKLRIKSVIGRYIPRLNAIELLETYKYGLPHELTHMASTIVKENGTILSGFHQIKQPISYGSGISEGYTQYFVEKHFLDSFPDILPCYQIETEIVKKLVCIIGEKEMDNLYFHANLSGLISSISHYSSLEEAKEFIAAVDFVKMFWHEALKSKKMRNMFIIKIQRIDAILSKCFQNKQIEEQMKGVSSYELKKKREEFHNYFNLETASETKEVNPDGSLEDGKSLKREFSN